MPRQSYQDDDCYSTGTRQSLADQVAEPETNYDSEQRCSLQLEGDLQNEKANNLNLERENKKLRKDVERLLRQRMEGFENTTRVEELEREKQEAVDKMEKLKRVNLLLVKSNGKLTAEKREALKRAETLDKENEKAIDRFERTDEILQKVENGLQQLSIDRDKLLLFIFCKAKRIPKIKMSTFGISCHCETRHKISEMAKLYRYWLCSNDECDACAKYHHLPRIPILSGENGHYAVYNPDRVDEMEWVDSSDSEDEKPDKPSASNPIEEPPPTILNDRGPELTKRNPSNPQPIGKLHRKATKAGSSRQSHKVGVDKALAKN